MATFATLPGDLLTSIASYVDTPHFVVAVAADGDARAAVRRGVDEAERALVLVGRRLFFPVSAVQARRAVSRKWAGGRSGDSTSRAGVDHMYASWRTLPVRGL